MTHIDADRDRLRKALEIARERFAGISNGRCPAPLGAANDPVAFREWAMAYANAGFGDACATLATISPEGEDGAVALNKRYQHLWVCDGCGTLKSLEQIKGESPAAIACCPERKMRPRTAINTDANGGRD